jgi:hypothetical protein
MGEVTRCAGAVGDGSRRVASLARRLHEVDADTRIPLDD